MLRSLVIVFVSLVAGCAPPRVEIERQPLRLGYNVESVNHAPIMVTSALGLFQEQGVTVELVPLRSGKEVRQAIALRRIDVGSGGAPHFFMVIGKGVPITIFAPSTSSPTQVFVRPDGNIRTLRDLEGKRVAARHLGSSDFALRYALRREGVDERKIDFVDIEKIFRPIALMEHKIIDAALGSSYEDVIYQEIGAKVLSGWRDRGYSEISFPRTVLAAPVTLLEDSEPLVRDFLEALIAGHRFMRADPGRAADLVAEHILQGTAGAVRLTRQDVLASWSEVKYELWQEPEILRELARIDHELGGIDRELTEGEILDMRFSEQLAAAQLEVYGAAD